MSPGFALGLNIFYLPGIICHEIKSFAKQVIEQIGLRIIIHTYGINQKLEENKALAFYRITQEALNNIVKYANAKNVKIQLIQHTDTIVLIIEDDGKGFDVRRNPDGNGIGLMNIQERVDALNGNLFINSSPNYGTEIMVEIPMTQNA